MTSFFYLHWIVGWTSVNKGEKYCSAAMLCGRRVCFPSLFCTDPEPYINKQKSNKKKP